MATGRDTSVDVIQASNERSSSAGTNEVETTDPPRIDRSTAENIQSERRDRYAKAVKLDETLDAFLVRLRLTSGIDVEDQILKIFCTEDKKHGVEQALQVELRDVDKILHPFVQVEEVDTEFSVVRHKGDVAADWSETDIVKDDGRVVIEPVRLFKEDKDLDSINPHETEVESLDNVSDFIPPTMIRKSEDTGHKDCPDAEPIRGYHLHMMWEARLCSIIILHEVTHAMTMRLCKTPEQHHSVRRAIVTMNELRLKGYPDKIQQFYLQKQEYESMKDFLISRRSAYKEDEDTFIQSQEPDSTNFQSLEPPLPQTAIRVVPVGLTAVIMTSLHKHLLGESDFKSSSRMECETSRVTSKTNCVPTDFAAMPLKIINTPGFSDCRNSDTKAIVDVFHQLADGINDFVFITSPGCCTPERNGCLEPAMSVAWPGILHQTILAFANAPDGLPDTSSLGTAPLSTPNEDWHYMFLEQKHELERILAHVEWVVMQLVAWILTSIKVEAKINAKLFESQMQAGVAALKLHNNMDPTWVSQYIYCWRNVYNNIKDME